MQQCTLKLTEEQKMLIREFWKEHENDELEGRNKILSSFCPQVYGLYHVKLAVFIVLCGGVEKRDQTGVRYLVFHSYIKLLYFRQINDVFIL